MGLSLLSACGNATETVKVIDRGSVVCDVLLDPVNTHMNIIIDNGEKLIVAGVDEVIVTASELSDVYERSCKNK